LSKLKLGAHEIPSSSPAGLYDIRVNYWFAAFREQRFLLGFHLVRLTVPIAGMRDGRGGVSPHCGGSRRSATRKAMPDLGPHAFFILSAYAATALIMAGLVLRAVIDHRVQARALMALEQRGVRRRSGGWASGDAAAVSSALEQPRG
jgi:heme exporter protein D